MNSLTSAWWKNAACADRYGEFDFFAKPWDAADRLMVARCKTLCALCVVRNECLEDALARDEEWGIWGGLTRRERKLLARRTVA